MPDDLTNLGFHEVIPEEGQLTNESDDEEDEFLLDAIIDVRNDIVPPDEDDD